MFVKNALPFFFIKDNVILPELRGRSPFSYEIVIRQIFFQEISLKVIDFLISDPARVLALSSASGFGEWMVPVPITADDFPAGTDERIMDFFADFADVTGQGRIGYTTWTFWPAAPNVQLWEAIENVWVGDDTVDNYLAEHQALWDAARQDGQILPVPAPASQ